MTNPLENQGAVVTGGSSGIGLAATAALVRDGAHVVIMGRSSERLSNAVEQLAAQGLDRDRVSWVAGDVADLGSVQEAVQTAAAAPLGIRIAIAAAGLAGIGPLVGATRSDWEPLVETNIYGTLNLLSTASEAMLETGGAVCAVSSNFAARPGRFGAAYCATKAAVDAMVTSAADELGPAGIRVNSVLPGLTRTEMVEPVFESEAGLAAFTDVTPLGGWSTAQDVGELIRFLVGPESIRITGEHIRIDGGQSTRRTSDFLLAARTRFPDLHPKLLQ